MTSWLMLAAGLATLALGAEVLVRGASRLALSWGLTPLVVGLTVVAFGTSAPEVAVSVGAVLGGQTDIAVGNVVGSNILNVLLILGLCALVVPLAVDRQVVRQEVPVMVGATLLMLVLAHDGRMGATDGALLAASMVAYTVYLVVQARRRAAGRGVASVPRAAGSPPAPRQGVLPVLLIVLGLGLLVLGAHGLVRGAVDIARQLGLSEVVIGLTIVAAGTSMPELATSLAAALRGERGIAVGNVVGSCIFNILGCLGLAGLVSGSAGLDVAPSLLRFDIWVMVAVALACLPLFFSGHELSRVEGAFLLLACAAYLGYVVLSHGAHPALPRVASTLMAYAAPLTVVVLIASMLPRLRRA